MDGQQRLQSLYVALFGSYNSERLYFDVLSGRPGDDYSEERYEFRFDTAASINERNDDSKAIASNANENSDWVLPEHFIAVSTLFGLGVNSLQKLRKQLVRDLSLKEDDELRVESILLASTRFSQKMRSC